MHNNVIFLVEDNPDDEELTIHALKQHNIANEILVARDGAEALRLLFDSGKPLPQLILLDLKLPKISGLDVLRRIRADPRTELIPVVILTSSAQDEDLISGYKLGANSYVRKPVQFARFVEAASLIGTYWLALNEATKTLEAERGSATPERG